MADDDIFYQQVADELGRNELDPGLMAKATGKSLGDKDLAKSLYIELRVENLKIELVNRLAAEEAARKAEEAARRAEEVARRAEEVARRAAERAPDSDHTDWATDEAGLSIVVLGLVIGGFILVLVLMLLAS